MKKRLLSGLIGLMAAQPALSMDLVETYEKALSYDSGIAAARASFEAQQAASDVSQSASVRHRTDVLCPYDRAREIC